jgi:hypothetical protein
MRYMHAERSELDLPFVITVDGAVAGEAHSLRLALRAASILLAELHPATESPAEVRDSETGALVATVRGTSVVLIQGARERYFARGLA